MGIAPDAFLRNNRSSLSLVIIKKGFELMGEAIGAAASAVAKSVIFSDLFILFLRAVLV